MNVPSVTCILICTMARMRLFVFNEVSRKSTPFRGDCQKRSPHDIIMFVLKMPRFFLRIDLRTATTGRVNKDRKNEDDTKIKNTYKRGFSVTRSIVGDISARRGEIDYTVASELLIKRGVY